MYPEDIHPSLVAITDKNEEIIGTGFWILNSGQIMTSYHLIKDRTDIIIINNKHEKLQAKVIHAFPDHIWNIAILKADYNPEHFLVHSTDYEVNDDLIVPAWNSTSPLSTIIDSLAMFSAENTHDAGILPALRLREPVKDTSPVILQRDGKVIGMINPKIPVNLFIPFSALIDRLPGFNPIFREWRNKDLFNTLIKPLEVLRQIAKSNIEKLKTDGDYSDKHFVKRPSMSSAITAFRENDDHLLAITGKPGMGKTNQLAAFADEIKGAKNIFWLSPDTFDIRKNSIRTEIVNKLTLDLQESGETTLLAEDILHLNLQVYYSTVIIIDGLDNLSGSDEEINKWLSYTLKWIKNIGQKAIISCSPEFWQKHQDHINAALQTKCEALELDLFTKEESEQALSNYGLPASYATDKRCRHPFVLHVLSHLPELLHEHPLETLSVYKILEAYLEKKVQAIGTATNRSTDTMHLFLDNMGRHSFTTGQHYWPFHLAYSAGRKNKWMIDSFITHHLLVQTTEGFRFKHQWLATFILSNSHLFDIVKCDWASISKANDQVRHCIPWCFVRQQRHTSDILPQMQELSNYIIQHPEQRKQAIEYLINIIIFCEKPSWFFTCINQVAAAGLLTEKDITTLLEGAYFKFPQQMELIKHLYTGLTSCNLDPVTISPLLLNCLNDNRQFTLKLLATWLPVYTTRPGGNQHSLNNIACAIFPRYTEDNLELVMELLVEHFEHIDPASLQEDHTIDALGQIVHAHFYQGLHIIHHWVREGKHIPAIIQIAHQLAWNEPLDEEELLSMMVLIQTLFTQHSLSGDDIMVGLLVFKKSYPMDAAIVDHSLKMLGKGDFHDNIYESLEPYADEYYEELSDPLLNYILHGEDEQRVLECCKLLPLHMKMQIEHQQLVNSLTTTWESPQQTRLFALLPNFLQATQYNTATYTKLKKWLVDGLLNLALPASNDMIAYLCDWNSSTDKRKDNLSIIHLLSKSTDNIELLTSICIRLIEDHIYISDETILETIKPALTKSVKGNTPFLNTVITACELDRPSLHYHISTTDIGHA
jgi:hypothetical protein